MSQFHFLRPDWFWILLPIALLLFWLWRHQLRSRSWQAVCDPQLLPYLLLGRSRRRQNWPLHLLLTAALLAIIALAGPTWERLPQPLFRQNSALVILLDLSASMNAADLKPSRLVRARLKITDILRQRREGQTALVAFAGDAFTVTPLTDDSKTIESLLDSLEPGLMPVFGSRPELAIKQGQRLLQQAGLANGDLLLVTDDDQPDKALVAAEGLQQSGYRLSVLGIGTEAGAPIPLKAGGFFKDSKGQVVMPRLKPAALRELAQAGGGIYQTIRVDNQDLKRLLAASLQDKLESDPEQSDQLGDQWKEAGVWLLWPLLLLSACAFRRGWLTMFIFCTLLTQPAQAFDWQQLWQRPDQQGARAFAEKDYAHAAEQFQDPRWQASAHYRNGNYTEAAKLLEQAESAEDWYNLGNALAKSGQLAEAINAYEEALKLNPKNQDALANKQLIEDALEQQQQSSPESNDSPSQKDEPASDKSESAPKNQDSSPQQPESGSDQKNQQADDDSSQNEGEPSSANRGQKPTGPDNTETEGPGGTETENRDSPEAEDSEQQKPQTASTEKEVQKTEPASTDAAEAMDDPAATEEQRANQQWLQRIPDDPGGLLRRKFLYQYRQRDERQTSDKPW